MLVETDDETFARLDALSRTRALTEPESLALERCMWRMARKNCRPKGRGNWTPDDDAKLLELRRDGISFSIIAELLSRSRTAVMIRARKLQA